MRGLACLCSPPPPGPAYELLFQGSRACWLDHFPTQRVLELLPVPGSVLPPESLKARRQRLDEEVSLGNRSVGRTRAGSRDDRWVGVFPRLWGMKLGLRDRHKTWVRGCAILAGIQITRLIHPGLRFKGR